MSIRQGNNIIAGSKQYHPDLFDFKWSDHILNDVQWLRADTFSWQSGSVYEAAYNHLSDDLHELVLTNDYSTFNKFNLIRWDTASTLGIFQIAWTGNRYVIIYYINNINTVRYLNKGASGSWSSFSNTNLNGNGHQFRTVEWNGEQLVALAGDGYISFGTIENDDTTWTVPVQGPATVTGDSWTRLIWNGSFYLAVTLNTNYVSTSTDGIVWTTPTQVNISSLYRCLTWDGTRFITLFTNNSQIYMSTSTDGLNWTNPVITNLSNKPFSVVWAENKYVGIFSSTISTSTDGITWTERYSASTGGYNLYYG